MLKYPRKYTDLAICRFLLEISCDLGICRKALLTMQFIFIVKSEELKIHISQFDQDLDCSFTASLKSVEFTGESDSPDHC